MVDIEYSKSFEKAVRKIRDVTLKNRIVSHIKKVVNNPDIGKPLRYNLRGERTIYLKPYRIIYSYNNNLITFLVFEHRDDVYE